VAVTVAATVATAPLIAFHFERLSTTTLLANVLALPAVAPAMWLGMASAAAAQVPGLPSELLNVPNAVLLAYIAQVASWCAAPDWAELGVDLSGTGLAIAYAVLGIATAAAHLRPRLSPRVRRNRPMRWVGADSWIARAGLVVLAAAAAVAALWPGGGARALGPVEGLRVTVLDVGQGDAILLQPARAPAVLVDGGPPGAGLARELDGAGVDHLGAVVATHDQSDHVGGIEELLGSISIGHLLYGRLGRDFKAAARAAAIPTQQAFRGTVIRSGSLRLEFLWPPPELLREPQPGADPNRLALVAVARWRGFSMLLSADAETEAVPLDPGPIDVLKVAHHGSEDAGLASLLDRARPALAVISVGEDNPYGHPAASTLAALALSGVPTLRTDRDGAATIEVGRDGAVEVAPGRG
jgi:competence protein ComEC